MTIPDMSDVYTVQGDALIVTHTTTYTSTYTIDDLRSRREALVAQHTERVSAHLVALAELDALLEQAASLKLVSVSARTAEQATPETVDPSQ